jgi:hypothetical protein
VRAEVHVPQHLARKGSLFFHEPSEVVGAATLRSVVLLLAFICYKFLDNYVAALVVRLVHIAKAALCELLQNSESRKIH